MNTMHVTPGIVGAGDADIMVSLKAETSSDGRICPRLAPGSAAGIFRA